MARTVVDVGLTGALRYDAQGRQQFLSDYTKGILVVEIIADGLHGRPRCLSVMQTHFVLLPLFLSLNKCLLYHTVSLLSLIPPPRRFFLFKQWIISQTGTSCFSNYINICPRVYWFGDHSNQVRGNEAIPLLSSPSICFD